MFFRQTIRCFSGKITDVATIPSLVVPRKRVTVVTLAEKFIEKIPITMCTAYDRPSAMHVDNVCKKNYPCWFQYFTISRSFYFF